MQVIQYGQAYAHNKQIMIGDCKRLFGCLSIAVYKAQQYPSACKNHYGSNQYGCYDSDKKSLTVPEPDALFFSFAEVVIANP